MELYRPGIDVRAEAIVAKSRPWSRVAISEPPCAAGQGRTGSRVVKDGSVHDERVVFSQLRVLAQQRDPRDAARAVVSRDGGGLTRPEDGAKNKRPAGSIELPPDVYNGMVAMLLTRPASGGRRPRAASDPLRAETQAGRGPLLLRHRNGNGTGRPRVRHPDRRRPRLRALRRTSVCQGTGLANRADGRSLIGSARNRCPGLTSWLTARRFRCRISHCRSLASVIAAVRVLICVHGAGNLPEFEHSGRIEGNSAKAKVTQRLMHHLGTGWNV